MAAVRPQEGVIKEPVCLACVHLIYWPYCEAYPDGIPDSIRLAESDHQEPMEGDHGLQFERGDEGQKWILLDGQSWADVYAMAADLSEWEDTPTHVSCPMDDGLWVEVKGLTVSDILEIGRNADLAYLQGYAEAAKGGPGSGNWGHTSRTRVGVGRGGSDPGTGAIDNPLGYLSAHRRALREGSEIRRKVMTELQELHPEWSDVQLDMAIGVMELDRDKFTEYANKWGLDKAGNVDDMATAFFKDAKARDRAWYQKKMALEEKAVMPHPEGTQYKMFMSTLGPGLYDVAKERPPLGADLAEAKDIFQRRYGTQVHVGANYDPATAREELSWLAHMMDEDPKLQRIYSDHFKSVRFHNERHGSAAMQVNGLEVAVYPTLHSPSMWYHEAGHGLENMAEEAGLISFKEISPIFGQGRLASNYSLGNYQEDFAEAWVLMGSGYAQEYAAWTPEKAAIMRRAMEVVQ